jgi:effector-binding domain-containing protein
VPAYEVQVTDVAPRRLAAVRSRTSLPELGKAIRAGLDQVWPHINDRSGLNVVVYHPSEPTGLGNEFDIETGVEVPEGFVPKPPVYLTRTPSGRAVTTAHFGSYTEMAGAYRAIEDYVRREGLRLTGPSWEVYGHWNDDPAKVRTDIFFPVG